MGDAMPSLPRTLEEHAAFVRALSRVLVRDPQGADDLVQDTWVQALEHPPRHAANLRAWLGSVVERCAARAKRGRRRRARREELAARREREPSVVEGIARRELLRQVTDAVLALEEPYQSTLLLRYYDGLDARAIAARAGVPEATVRSRLQRALAKLRVRLDSEWNGDRAAWCVALGGSFEPKVAPIASGGAQVAVGGALLMGRRTDADGVLRIDGLLPGSVAVITAHGTEDSKEVIAGETTRLELRVPLGFRVHGKVVDAAGEAVAGARPWLSEYFNHTNGFVVSQTRADGSFEIDEVPEARYLGAIADGFAPSHLHLLRDYQPPEQADADVEITLRLNGAGGRLALELVDRAGNPVSNATVRVTGAPPMPLQVENRHWLRSSPTFDVRSDARGLVNVDGLPPRWARVRVWAAGMGVAEKTTSIEVDSTVALRMVLDLEAVVRGKVLTADGAPAVGASVALAGEYDPSMPRTEVGIDGSYELGSLPPGKVSLVAGNSELGRAETLLRLAPGEVVEWNAMLESGRVVEGRVIDDEDRPLAGWWVQSTPVEETNRTKQARTDEQGCFRLLNVEPGPLDVAIFRDVYTEVFATQRRRLGAGESDVLFRVGPGDLADGTLAGRIVDARGEPVLRAGVAVRLPSDESGRVWSTDSTGAFRIEHLPPGSYEVGFTASDRSGRRLRQVVIESGATLDLGTQVLEEAAHVLLTVEGRSASESTAFASYSFREFEGDHPTPLDYCERAKIPGDVALMPGRYLLRAQAEAGHADAIHVFELRPGDRLALDLVSRAGRRVDVTLGLASGDEERVQARLIVRDERGESWIDDRMPVGPQVVWRLGLAPGSYTLEAATDDGRSARQSFDVALDEQATLQVHADLR